MRKKRKDRKAKSSRYHEAGCGLVGGVDGEEEDEGLGRGDEKEEEEEVGLGRVEAGGSCLGGVVGGGSSSASPDSARSSQACADTQAPTQQKIPPVQTSPLKQYHRREDTFHCLDGEMKLPVEMKVPVEKVLIFGFAPLVLILVGGVGGDATKYSCAVLWLYLAWGLRCRRCSGINLLHSYN